MKSEVLLLVIFLTLLGSCESNNSKDVSNEICDCLKEKYVRARNKSQADLIKIGENCVLKNLDKQLQELDKRITENDRVIKKSLMNEKKNQTMESLKSNCIYFKTFTNDKLNQIKNEFKD